jgi:hypothetical protein
MDRMDGRQPPEQADIVLGALEGVYGPQNTPMLWQCIIAGTKESFEGHTHPQPPQKTHPQAWGVVTHPSKHCRGAQGLVWGARGPFLPLAAMLVAVVMPVVFCVRLLKIAIKTLKFIF